MVVHLGPYLILSHVRMFSRRRAKVRGGMGGFKKRSPRYYFHIGNEAGAKSRKLTVLV
jgi:hypothetical protein